jgi:hypothetical protein
MRGTSLVLAACCCAAPGIAWSQQADSPQERAVARQRLEARINSQERIRVLTTWGQAELYQPVLSSEALNYGHGRLLGPTQPGSPEGERMLPEGFPRALQLSDVSEMQVRTAATKRGLLIGSVAFGILGLAAGVSTTEECQGFIDIFCGSDAGDVAVVTAGTAVVGGMVGALIGSVSKRWKTVYRAPGQQPGKG